MKTLIVTGIILLSSFLNSKNDLQGTTWTMTVSRTCVNVLKLKPKHTTEEYDCELGFTFKGNYTIKQDTLLITFKDNSHSEDSSKLMYYREKYLIKGSTLNLVSHGSLIRNKWEDVLTKNRITYKRMK